MSPPPPHPTPRASRQPSSDVEGRPANQTSETRRQTRKGTRSCWECRRRKVRCKFDDAVSRDVCRSCRRRGAVCVGQDLPEETSHRRQPVTSQDTPGRLDRLELLVGHMLDGDGGHSQPRETSVPGPATRHTRAPGDCDPLAGPRSHRRDEQRLPGLSRKLVALLPSDEDCLKIYQLGGFASHCYHQIVAGSCSDTWSTPPPDYCEERAALVRRATHPALIAKLMLEMAATLQRTRPPADALSENPEVLQKRLADAAISLVCNDDQVMGTVEALECLVTQMAYVSNQGSLRVALLASRRAITMCQLMGLHQSHSSVHVDSVEEGRTVNPRHIWFGVVYVERLICLLLGLPSAARDMNDSGDGEFSALSIGDTPIGQLQRTHCIVAARIIERNQTDPFFRRSRQETQAIDLELERSAALMPPRWWANPRLTNASSSGDFALFLDIHRLSHRVFHQFLLIQLHLPFILRPATDPENLVSKSTCINASRDVLALFVAAGHVRELSMIPEASDFFALIAAIALLLAHIDARRGAEHPGPDMALRHQRLTDRALLADTLDFMRVNSSKSSDMLSKKSSDVLRRLMEIEEDAAAGQRYTTSPGPGDAGGGERNSDNPRDFHLKIPYFGTLVISPDRPVTRAPLADQTTTQDPLTLRGQSIGLATFGAAVDPAFASNPALPSTIAPSAEGLFVHDGGFPAGGEGMDMSGQQAAGVNMGEAQDTWYPSVSTTAEDWAFQGVDAAFFDNIMRGLVSPSPGPASGVPGGNP